MNKRQGFLDHLFAIYAFTPEQQDQVLKKLQEAVLSQFVAREVLDQVTLEKLTGRIRRDISSRALSLDSLVNVFTDKQRESVDDILNRVCDILEDTFIANSTPEQKRQMLMLLASGGREFPKHNARS